MEGRINKFSLREDLLMSKHTRVCFFTNIFMDHFSHPVYAALFIYYKCFERGYDYN